jgi:hypothetical protein
VNLGANLTYLFAAIGATLTFIIVALIVIGVLCDIKRYIFRRTSPPSRRTSRERTDELEARDLTRPWPSDGNVVALGSNRRPEYDGWWSA